MARGGDLAQFPADEDGWRQLVEAVPDILIVVARDGTLLYANRTVRPFDPAGVVGTHAHEYIPEEGRPMFDSALAHVFEAREDYVYEIQATGPDGRLVWYASHMGPIVRDGEVVAAVLVSRDVSDQVETENELALTRASLEERVEERTAALERTVRELTESEAKLAEAQGLTHIGSWEWLIDTNEVSWSDELYRIYGLAPNQFAATFEAYLERVHPEDRELTGQRITDIIEGAAQGFSFEERIVRPDGSVRTLQSRGNVLRDADGRAIKMVGVCQDISDRKRVEGQLQYLADHDTLTGLFNRRRFEEVLERHLAYVERYGTGGAVLVLDLDNFKYVNDTLGHHAGDELIVQVARTMRERLRRSDVIARLGGDEFAVLLPEADVGQARTAAAGLLTAVRGLSVMVRGQRVRVTTSVGIALVGSREGLDAEKVLVEADLAMYDAKSAGRNRFALYTPAAVRQAQIESRLEWAERIRRALEGDDFVLYAQPIIDVSTADVARFEILLRLRGDDGGLVPPGAFLSTAERFGLMPSVDRWVVRQSIALLAEHARPDVSLDVNLSGESVSDRELPALIESELLRHGVDGSRLGLEVTETAAIADIDDARSFGQRLVELGVRFALDDFGAGFGSLYYLKYLPFDHLKIDGDFIHSLAASKTDQLVVKAVVGIAQGLGKKTSAKWVGDDDTLVLLRDYGVDMAQGYQLGRPQPAIDLIGAAVPT